MKMNKVILYIAMSLDGYIAREDGAVDWLEEAEGDGGDNGYADFYETIGALVMGRKTYESVLGLSETFPYAGKPCYVLSTTRRERTEHAVFTDEALDSLIPSLAATTRGDVWIVGGGELVRSVMERGLLDELHLAVIPKVLGGGIPLFPQGTVPTSFRLRDMEQMGQIVMLRYSVDNGKD